jgi:hypothetical protein
MILERKPRWWRDGERGEPDRRDRHRHAQHTHHLNAFGYGALFGVGTLYYMALNGLAHASVLALTYRAGYGHELLTFMAGHGPIELSCIFIAGGGGLLFGTALLFPGDIPRFDNLRLRGREAIQLASAASRCSQSRAPSKASSPPPQSRPR